jgi:hypothetical protein
MRYQRSVGSVVFGKVMGFLFFLFLLYIANVLAVYIESPAYLGILNFINNNLVLLIVMSVVFLVGSIFDVLIFPFNLSAPIFNSIGAVLVVIFIHRMFLLLDTVTGQNISIVFTVLSFLIYPLVFLFVLVGGYISIFARLFSYSSYQSARHPSEQPKKKSQEKVIDVKRVRSWDDVGNEFRQTIYDFLAMLRRAFRGK